MRHPLDDEINLDTEEEVARNENERAPTVEHIEELVNAGSDEENVRANGDVVASDADDSVDGAAADESWLEARILRVKLKLLSSQSTQLTPKGQPRGPDPPPPPLGGDTSTGWRMVCG